MDRKEAVLRAFGQQLAVLRKEKKLSVRELAAAAGIREAQLRRIEAGKVNILLSSIMALSKALGINPEELLQSLDRG